MSGLLENSKLTEERSVICFLIAESGNRANIYSRMTWVYSESWWTVNIFTNGLNSSKVSRIRDWQTPFCRPVEHPNLNKQYTEQIQYYSDMLLNMARPAMREKRGSYRRGVILQQDYGRPLVPQLTHETIDSRLEGNASSPLKPWFSTLWFLFVWSTEGGITWKEVPE